MDTNVLVSGFSHKTGPPGMIFDSWKKGDFTLVVSEYILNEFIVTVNKKFKISQTDLLGYLQDFYSSAQLVKELDVKINEIKPNDWAILGTAVAGRADFLITGDKLILKLNKFSNIPIITPADFLKHLK